MAKKCENVSYTVVLVLLWSYLVNLEYILNQYVIGIVYFSSYNQYCAYTSGFLAFFLYPFFGLLADVWIGRYNALLFGIGMCFLSWMTIGIGYIVNYYYMSLVTFWSLYATIYFLQLVGYTSFTANIIQFTIDQFVGASAYQLNAVIYWLAASLPLTYMLLYFVNCVPNDTYLNLIAFIASGIAISLVVTLHSLFEHKLECVSLIKNPIKLIVRVLCYARKHKYPENRSALTYWEEKAPSRLDLGKGKYGGPFKEEEVENVKTFFRILPLFIAVLGFACSDDSSWSSNDKASWTFCLLSTDFAYNALSFLLFMVYLSFIRVFFSKYVPKMLTRISVGLFLALASILLKLIPFNRAIKLILSQLLLGLSHFLIAPTSLEFTIAQSPVQMRGVMVAFWYASWSAGYFLSTLVKFPFHCQDQPTCTIIYYHLTKSVLVLIILIVFVILAKRYKYRVRENEINIVQVVDDHYHKYLKQKEEYYKEHNLYSSVSSSFHSFA